jgi:hypothetical protein
LTPKIDHFFRVYGDDYQECDLFIDLLKDPNSGFSFQNFHGPIDRPLLIFKDSISKKLLGFHICPNYGSKDKQIWKNNPLDKFSEKTDIQVRYIETSGKESEPLFAMEFDDAIQAGNQSWQRFRRATDAAKNNFPYIYVLPMLIWERDSKDPLKLKSPRYQNAMVTFGHLSLMAQYKTLSLQIFKHNAWSEKALKEKKELPKNFKNFQGEKSVIKLISYLIRKNITKNNPLPEKEFKQIISEMLLVAEKYSFFSDTKLPIHNAHDSLQSNNSSQITNYYNQIILKNKSTPLKFSPNTISFTDFKTASLFTKDAQKKTFAPQSDFPKLLEKINRPPTEKQKRNESHQKYQERLANTEKAWAKIWKTKPPLQKACLINTKIPCTYKENKSEAALIPDRSIFRSLIQQTYPKLDKAHLDWIYTKNSSHDPIFFIPMYGYKPSGDSRPDRGLIPLLYSNFPQIFKKNNTVVIMYSKETPLDWKTKLQAKNNELWNSIKEFCGLVIVDKTKTGELL